MDGARTHGHASALAAIDAMLRTGPPHAMLLTGPAGIGKTTLATDIAAGLLCRDPDAAARPCGTCRGCRLREHGNHPDLHWLRPVGPGGQIILGKKEDLPDSPPRGVRHLVHDLSRLPMEGGARVAIIEAAHRMGDEAQGALLKTLEEPPTGVTIILCADEEAMLLPTIRSRCARLRLGPVGARDIEAILADQGVADAPLAARLARLAGGRPGVALAWARAPEALRLRGELARTLLDLLDRGPSARLTAMREAIPSAMALAAALDAGAVVAADQDAAARPGPKGRRRTTPSTSGAARAIDPDPTTAAADGDDPDADPEAPVKGPPVSQRRRAVEVVVTIWIDIARDLALAQVGATRSVHDPALLEELTRAARGIEPGAAAAALERLEHGATLLASNVSPELVLDSLALGWPRHRDAA